MSQIRTSTISGASVFTLRMDLIISIKNYPLYRSYLDLSLHNTSQNKTNITHTTGAITELLSKSKKIELKAFVPDRTFSLAEYFAFKVPEQLDFEIARMIRDGEASDTINLIASDSQVDYVPPVELSLQIYGSKKKSTYYILPITFIGEHNALVGVEEFFNELTTSQRHISMVQEFIQTLPLCTSIKREISTSFIGYIPPNVNTLNFVRRRIECEERPVSKKKDQE